MLSVSRALVAFGLVASLASSPAASYELVWQDEFDGTELDLSKWEPQIGTGCPQLCGWGNNELQYYRAENAKVEGGFLTITAKEEAFGGRDYTSARLRTKNLGDWTRGRFEMRAKMPIGQGLWPAFWMLPTDGAYGIWAASGEIDIVEYLGQDPDRVFGTIHYGGEWPANQFSSNGYTLGTGTFHDDFHEFALEWDECEMRWYVDGHLYATQRDWFSTGGSYPAPFDRRFHLLLNMAVGGNLPGPPDETTMFPQELVVDWVRVYREPGVDVGPCFTLFDGMEHGNLFANGWFSFGGSVGGGGINLNVADLPPIDGCTYSLESGWGSGGAPGFFGGFGRTNPLDLGDRTHFTFWINPDPGQEYTLEINLQDDDDGDDSVPGTPNGADDEFQFDCHVSPTGPHAVSGGGWQHVSIPFADFFDDNSFHFGGNGVFDPVPVTEGGNGQLANVVFVVIGSGSDVSFRTDQWAFPDHSSAVSGRVWEDENGNGVLDGPETGLEEIGVELRDPELGAILETVVTASDGSYSFGAMLGGTWEVGVDPTTLPAGVVPTFDPDGTGTAGVFTLDLECDEVRPDQDFGYSSAPSDVTPGPGVDETLRQNVPNPFRPGTVIEFELPREGFVELAIFDVTGRRIRTLVRSAKPAGAHHMEWDGRDDSGHAVAGGVYFYELRTADGQWVKRMARLR